MEGDRQIGRQRGRQTDIDTGGWKHTEKQIERDGDKSGRQTQITDRQTDIGIQTETQTQADTQLNLNRLLDT